MAVEAKTKAPLIQELGTAQKKLSPFSYFSLLPLLLLTIAILFASLANGAVNATTDSEVGWEAGGISTLCFR
jgi:hypothetical protein